MAAHRAALIEVRLRLRRRPGRHPTCL